MDRISIVVPHLWLNKEKGDLLTKFVDSVQGQYEELIVVADKADNLASVINKGIAKTTGDYIMVSNDDLTLLKGSLRDLCNPDYVTVPKVIGGLDKLFHGHFWCMPRKIFEKVGYMYEGYDGFFYDDSDYWMSIEKAGFKIVKREDIVVLHPHPGTTLSQLHRQGREENNRNLFIERWGKDALRRVE